MFLHKLINIAPSTNLSEYKNDADDQPVVIHWRVGTLKAVMKMEIL